MNARRNIAGMTRWTSALAISALLAVSTPYLLALRDRGVNQAGAAGNRGRDLGVNQPGAVGNGAVGGSARQTRAVADPGLNQPGAAGNAGNRPGDPGVNQVGAAGNRR